MTRFIIWCGRLIGAGGGGYLAYRYASWLEMSPGWVWPAVGIGAIAGFLIGWLLGFVVAGLMEA